MTKMSVSSRRIPGSSWKFATYDVTDDDGSLVILHVSRLDVTLYLDPAGRSRSIRIDLSREEVYALAEACAAIACDDMDRQDLTDAERARAKVAWDCLGDMRMHGTPVAAS